MTLFLLTYMYRYVYLLTSCNVELLPGILFHFNIYFTFLQLLKKEEQSTASESPDTSRPVSTSRKDGEFSRSCSRHGLPLPFRSIKPPFTRLSVCLHFFSRFTDYSGRSRSRLFCFTWRGRLFSVAMDFVHWSAFLFTPTSAPFHDSWKLFTLYSACNMIFTGEYRPTDSCLVRQEQCLCNLFDAIIHNRNLKYIQAFTVFYNRDWSKLTLCICRELFVIVTVLK